MKLASLLNPSLVKMNCRADSKEQVINDMLNEVYQKYSFEFNRDEIYAKIMERESVSTTVIEGGLFVPHVRVDGFKDFIIIIGIPKIPNKLNVKMITMILASNTASGLYLNVLSSFAKIIKHDEIFSKMVSAQNGHEFIEIIKDNEYIVKKNLTIEDIMSKKVISINPDSSIKDLTDLMFKNNTSYIPVVDADNKFLGEVTVLDVIKAGIPNYAQMLSNLKFLNTLEPFDELLKNEKTISVKTIMTKPDIKLSKDSSVIEAAFELSQNKKRQIPVVENGLLVGIISYMDILNKILRS